MKNRIISAVSAMESQIANRLRDGLTTPERVEETRKALDMDLGEYVRFQELKTLAVAQQKLTLDEGMTVYGYLGTVPTVFNAQPVAVKAVLTQLFKDLLMAKR